MFGARTNQHKYIRYHGIWDTNELYDLPHDPHETTNLISKPEYAPVAQKMAHELFNWLEQTNGLRIPLKRTVKQPFGDYRRPLQY